MNRLFEGSRRARWRCWRMFAARCWSRRCSSSSYVLSVLIIVLYFAYVGQAWNLMIGFAGQLSLGHALFVGIGAYTSAALFIHFGIPPWIGVFARSPCRCWRAASSAISASASRSAASISRC